ncbi:S26 family signal peptidase [Streptomyces sp. NPDC046881]|uniref:S26 family signal peptidase n=1 Tax=Streptomyces sp. NPDC046881 TaxID=3155374 RepID=UPI0033DEBABD
MPQERVPGLPDSPTGLVPPGCLVLLGDNPAHSLDSRLVGCFPADRGAPWRAPPVSRYGPCSTRRRSCRRSPASCGQGPRSARSPAPRPPRP